MDAGNAVVADDACVGAPERGPASAEKREPNPVALLLAWSEENRGRYALSVLLAVIGVAGSIVPYVAAGQMIVGVLGGVRPTLKVRRMKTRWGVCMPGKRQITLNLRLAEKPMAAVEYVVVHEYAHFVHCDHSPAFWAVVARILPDYKARRALLRA